MPAIWNVNNGYNANNKKLSSKVTFETGEKFSGRISSTGNNNEAVIKLPDGWQFSAEIDGDLSEADQAGVLQFQVAGFEGGKLKLSIIKKGLEGQTVVDDSLNDVIEKEGLSKDDISLLKSMVKHDIPLIRENIIFVKSLIQFNDKIKEDPEEVDRFINNLLQGKGVAADSAQGQNIKNILTDFFNKYQTMSKEDILLFLENNIEINGDNIDSYNKLFKGGQNLKAFFESVAAKVVNLDNSVSGDESAIQGTKINSPEENVKNILNEVTQNKVQIEKETSKNGSIASKLYSSNDISKGKLSMLGILKSMVGVDTSVMKAPLRAILSNRASEFTTSQYNNINHAIENLTDDKLVSIVKDIQSDGNNFKNTDMQKGLADAVISKIFSKDVKLTDDEFLKIKGFLEYTLDEDTSKNVDPKKVINVANSEADGLKENASVKQASNNDIIFTDKNKLINVDAEKTRQVLNNIFQNRKSEFGMNESNNIRSAIINLSNDKIEELIKVNLTRTSNIDKDGFSKIVSQIFGKDINIINDEFRELKNIFSREDINKNGVNENLKDMKIDSKVAEQNNAVKQAPEEEITKNISSKELLNSIITERKSELPSALIEKLPKIIENLSEEKITSILKENLSQGKEIDKDIFKKIILQVTEEDVKASNFTKDEFVKLNSKESALMDFKGKIDDIKDIIKEIIQKTDSKGIITEKALEYIKANINDFKLFNSISNEYYYLDLPINQNNKEYPCKLIIKDNRKDGKKIDSTNVKLVVSVKTINLGDIDGFLNVRNQSLDVNIKCDGSYVKLINSQKQKLIDGLNEIGFISDVKVTEKIENVSLTSCREFFNDGNSKKIDTKV